jgi:hypothetical protein
MKPRHALGLLAAMILFMAGVVWSTLTGVETECEVCLTFGTEQVCRAGRGESEVEAIRAAQESVCGGNTSGMAEIIACRNATPERATCQAASP